MALLTEISCVVVGGGVAKNSTKLLQQIALQITRTHLSRHFTGRQVHVVFILHIRFNFFLAFLLIQHNLVEKVDLVILEPAHISPLHRFSTRHLHL